MAEEYTGKVCWSSEDLCYYTIPEDVDDKQFDPRDGQKARWIADNDDPEDPGGHFELIDPDDEPEEVAEIELMELEAGTSEGGSDAGL